MKKISLSQGLWALVSDEDYDRVNAFSWSASNESRGRKKWYAVRLEKIPGSTKRKKVRMGRFILGLSDGDLRVADHLDGDGLDNRRENLEAIYQDENMRRARGWHGHGSSKLKQKPARKKNHRRPKHKKIPKEPVADDHGAVQGSLI